MRALVTALKARAEAFGDDAVAGLYENPFWLERFGERGRRIAAQDGRYLLSYLAQALEAGDPGLLEKCARWLQTVVVSRGLCSRHLEEHLRLLGAATRGLSTPQAGVVAEYLRAAAEALRYEFGPGGELQRLQPSLAARAVEALPGVAPLGFRPTLEDEVLDHDSFLTDAVAVGRPDLFEGYALFLAGALGRRGQARNRLGAILDGLARAGDRAPGASEELRVRCAEIFARARAVVAAPF